MGRGFLHADPDGVSTFVREGVGFGGTEGTIIDFVKATLLILIF